MIWGRNTEIVPRIAAGKGIQREKRRKRKNKEKESKMRQKRTKSNVIIDCKAESALKDQRPS